MYVCTYVNKIHSICRKQRRDKRDAHKVLVRKHEGRIPSGRCRCCWDDNKMEVKYDMTVRNDSFEMEQGRRVCYCECGNESSFFLKWDFLTTNY
jgi:hypothetical protein